MLGRKLMHDQYCPSVDGILFFVDSQDLGTIADAKKELHRLLAEIQSPSCKVKDKKLSSPVLILANKQDSPNAIPASKMAEQLDVEGLKKLYPERKFGVMNAIAKEGLSDEILKFFVPTK